MGNERSIVGLKDGGEGWSWMLRTAVMLLAVALPFAVQVIPLFILLIAVAVVALRIKQGGGCWRRPSLASAMPWMALFYGLHVLGMAWSSNTAFGAFDLEIKAALLLFPVLLWLLPSNTGLDVPRTWRVFALANAAVVLICLVTAIWHFGQEWVLREHGELPEGAPWTNHFFESRFSLFLHPSYMAMYLCIALATLHFGGTEKPVHRNLGSVVTALLVLGVILCNSKMGWLTLAVVIGMAILGTWKDLASRRRLLITSGVGLALFVVLFMAFPTVSGKITQASNATGAIDPASDQSSALRRMAWDAATDLFSEQPLTGVGTGDIKDALIEVYHVKGYVHPEAKRMNAHSQFLQSAAALGIPGLLTVFAMILLPLLHAVYNRDRQGFAFWLIIMLNWSVESMAEVQAGVLFVAFFAWLLELHRQI